MYPLLSLLLDGGAGEFSAGGGELFLEVLERNVVRLEGLLGSVADSGSADCFGGSGGAGGGSRSATSSTRCSARGTPVARAARASRCRSAPGPIRRVWADRDDARQIVADLVANAVAYTPPAGAVTVGIGVGREAASSRWPESWTRPASLLTNCTAPSTSAAASGSPSGFPCRGSAPASGSAASSLSATAAIAHS